MDFVTWITDGWRIDMFILDQDKKNLINVKNTICICTESKMVTAECTNGRDYVLGKYTTDGRADEVYKTLINTAFAPIVIANNCEIDIESIGELDRKSVV